MGPPSLSGTNIWTGNTPNSWHGRGTCWHGRREACRPPELAPGAAGRPWLRDLDSLPCPTLFVCNWGRTMVLSSSTRQMGGWNEVTNLKGQPCAQNAPSKGLLYYYFKKESYSFRIISKSKTNEGISALRTQQMLNGAFSGICCHALERWRPPRGMHTPKQVGLFSQQL